MRLPFQLYKLQFPMATLQFYKPSIGPVRSSHFYFSTPKTQSIAINYCM